MNFLAHLYLSLDDPELMLGNFIADDIKPSDVNVLPHNVRLGIHLHRRIDTFTDHHVSFRSAVEILRDYHGKYAPVIADIANDHLLYINWHYFDNRSFSHFENYVYVSLDPFQNVLRGKAKIHLNALLTHQYLKVYSHKEGLKNVMSRMDQKTTFPSDFVRAVDHMYDQFEFFNIQFKRLMSDLILELPDLLSLAKKDLAEVNLQNEMKSSERD